MTLEELKNTVNKYMLLADPNIVKFLCAVAVANKIPFLTPTWIFLVGASSGGKSSLLEPLRFLKDSFFLSDLTAKTLFSSMKSSQQDSAVIFQMPSTGGMVVIPDFTLMLNKDEQTAAEIMSQFRLIYDGDFTKLSGNNGNKSWSGRFGFIAGVTSAVYTQQQKYAALGERMIYYTFDQPDRLAALEVAYRNMDNTKEVRAEIGNAFKLYLSSIETPKVKVELEAEPLNNLKLLANMASKARSSVSRDKYQRNRMVQNDFDEMPMRLFKQLLNLSQGLIALNGDGKLHAEDQTILYKVALDSIPRSRMEVMVKLTSYERGDITNVAAALSSEYDTIKMTMQDLAAKGILTQYRGSGAGNFYFELKSEWRELMSKFKHIEMTNQTIQEQPGEDPMPIDPEPAPILAPEEQAALELFNS